MRTLALVCLVSFLPQAQIDQKPIPTIAIVQNDKVEIIWLAGARAEYAVLKRRRNLTPEEQVRKAALEIALGTLPDKPKCITWEQHKAEVFSWWAAPEREDADCDDPSVGPPENQK